MDSSVIGAVGVFSAIVSLFSIGIAFLRGVPKIQRDELNRFAKEKRILQREVANQKAEINSLNEEVTRQHRVINLLVRTLQQNDIPVPDTVWNGGNGYI